MRRFSIAGLMGIVALAGASLAALRLPQSAVRTSALFSLVILILLVASLGSVLGRKGTWIGFALFGWAWLLASFTALAIAPLDSTADRQPVPLLLPSILFVDWHVRAFGPGELDSPVAVLPNSVGGHSLVPHRMVQDYTCLASLLAACVGAVVARVMGSKDARSQ